MKRFAVLLLTLAMAFCCAAPAFAAGTIEVTEDVSVSDDYDWTRFQGQNLTLNVYNWGEYISNGFCAFRVSTTSSTSSGVSGLMLVPFLNAAMA